MWTFVLQGTLWRARIWERVGGDAQALALSQQGEVRAAWGGWRLRSGAVDVRWTGGLLGERTSVKAGGARTVHSGWLTEAQVLALVAEAP